jgi:uncharacterized membrane protein YccC
VITLPTGKAWLYAAKTFAAAMLALWIALAADLDRPYWAMATVYIASQPHAAGTSAKALYRLFGTLLGAAASLALVPALVDSPSLLTAALCVWLAGCTTLALLDRTPRGYVFTLAGYTAAIIGFPSVEAPGAIWDVALARSEEIAIGVVCATLVSRLVFPGHLAPDLAQRTNAWLGDGKRLAAAVLRGQASPAAMADESLRLEAGAVAIDALADQIRYDVSRQRDSAPALRAQHTRLLMLMPLLASIGDRLRALNTLNGITPVLAASIAGIAAWIDTGAAQAQAPLLRARIARLLPVNESQAGWPDIMRAGLADRLHQIIVLFEECAALQDHILAGRRGLPRLSEEAAFDATPLQHRDVPMALFAGASAAIAVAAVCAFWIATAWPDGAAAAEFAAICCGFFAAQDDPAPAITHFMACCAAAVLIVALYFFAILPRIDGFAMLAIALAPAFMATSLLAASRAFTKTGVAMGLLLPTLLALQGTYAADFAAFDNSSLAALAGIAAGAVITALIRSVGAAWSIARLKRATWRSLARAAIRRGRGDRADFAGLILERAGLVATRLVQIAPAARPAFDARQTELRIGLNIVDLRRARHALPHAVLRAIDAALDGIAAHYRGLAHAPVPAGAALLHRIDHAIALAAGLPAGATRRDALLGLVGIRLGLCPDATPPDCGQDGPGTVEAHAA